MVGVGLRDPVTLKLYAELSDAGEVLNGMFLSPKAKEIWAAYSPYHVSGTSSSLAVGCKVNAKMHRNYMHMKLKSAAPVPQHFVQMRLLNYLGIDINVLMKGISYEFGATDDLLKSYYYLETRDDISKFLASKRLCVGEDLVDHIELYFTSTDSKYNVIFKDANPDALRKLLTPYEERSVNEVLNVIPQPLLYVGRTKCDTTIYFSYTGVKSKLFD